MDSRSGSPVDWGLVVVQFMAGARYPTPRMECGTESDEPPDYILYVYSPTKSAVRQQLLALDDDRLTLGTEELLFSIELSIARPHKSVDPI